MRRRNSFRIQPETGRWLSWRFQGNDEQVLTNLGNCLRASLCNKIQSSIDVTVKKIHQIFLNKNTCKK